MDEKDAKIVQGKYVEIVGNLEARNVLGFLYQEGVLSAHDKEKIGTLSTSQEQNETLLDTLLKRKDGLKMLIKALLVTGVQEFLGHQLLEVVEWNEEERENFKLELEGKIDKHQMLKATIAVLNQEINQLKAKEAKHEKTIKDITDQNQRLVDSEATLKQENYQLKAKKAEYEKLIKDITDLNQALMAKLKQQYDQLKAKEAACEKTITDQNHVLAQEINQLKAKEAEQEKTIKDITDQNQVLVDSVAALKLKETIREETLETTESSEQEYPQRRARRNAISRKDSCAAYLILLKLDKINILHQEIKQLRAKSNGISETSLPREEQASKTWKQGYQQRKRRNTKSFREGDRIVHKLPLKWKVLRKKTHGMLYLKQIVHPMVNSFTNGGFSDN